MDRLLQSPGVLGLTDCSSDSDGAVVFMEFEELTDGHTYRTARDHTDRLTKIQGQLQVVEGTQKNKVLQADVSVIKLLRDPPLLLLLIPALSLSRL